MTYTPAQVGAANVPTEHATGYAPPLPPQRAANVDELPAEPSQDAPHGTQRWRLAPTSTSEQGPPLASTRVELAADHRDPGHPDPRRVWESTDPAGYPEPKRESLRPARETPQNVDEPESIRTQAPPVQVRAGSTGADPAHVARLVISWFLRPFDKNISDHPGGTEKVVFASPLASVPIHHGNDVAGGLPNAGGTGGTAPDPVGTAPNTWRILPQPWDEYLVATGGQGQESAAMSGEAARRGRGWKL